MNHLKAALQDVRNNMDDHYTEWFCQAEQLCDTVSITPSVPRRCKCQQHRYMSHDEPAEYYKRTVAISLLDHLLAQLEMRFIHLHQKAFQCLSIIPSILATVTPAEGSRRIQELGDLYWAELPSPGSVNSEVHTWHVRWENKAKEQGPTSLPTTLIILAELLAMPTLKLS